MAVDDKVDFVTDRGAAHLVGQASDAQQVGRFEQGNAVGGREALLASNLVFDNGEGIKAVSAGHSPLESSIAGVLPARKESHAVCAMTRPTSSLAARATRAPDIYTSAWCRAIIPPAKSS